MSLIKKIQAFLTRSGSGASYTLPVKDSTNTLDEKSMSELLLKTRTIGMRQEIIVMVEVKETL